MSNRLETAIKASAAEARLTKQKVLKELKQRMEGLIQQIENDRLWISDLKELHNQVAEAVAKVTAADEKIKTEELFRLSNNQRRAVERPPQKDKVRQNDS